MPDRIERPARTRLNPRLWDAIERLRETVNSLSVRRLRCVECGVESEGSARGWRAPLTVDDEVATYCPDCARKEFGDG